MKYNRDDILIGVLAQLEKQGVRSETDLQGCLYRGKNNTKCAIGWLIPDEEYSKDMEWKSMEDPLPHAFIASPTLMAISKDVGAPFLRSLQLYHDDFFKSHYSISEIMAYIEDLCNKFHISESAKQKALEIVKRSN